MSEPFYVNLSRPCGPFPCCHEADTVADEIIAALGDGPSKGRLAGRGSALRKPFFPQIFNLRASADKYSYTIDYNYLQLSAIIYHHLFMHDYIHLTIIIYNIHQIMTRPGNYR